jgi:hypothetical protein
LSLPLSSGHFKDLKNLLALLSAQKETPAIPGPALGR